VTEERGPELGRLSPDPVPAQGRLARVRRLATIDVTPLRRHRDFRLLFVGQVVSFFGSMITFVALPFQVFELTDSYLAVGALSSVEIVPLVLTALAGGALADSVDRRRLVRVAEAALAVCSLALMANALAPRPQVWVLFVVAAVMAALDGLQRPALESLTPRLVARDELVTAGALSSLRMNIGMVGGPALGGFLIAGFGLPVTYGIDALTFAFSLGVLALMRPVPPPPDAERPSLRRIVEGIRYARSRPELVGTYGVDIIAMIFGMPEALFPGLAQRLGGPGALGLLYAAPSLGSLLMTLTSGWTSIVRRHGVAVMVAAAGWGVAIAAVGFAPSLPLALAALLVAGAADMVSGIFRTAIWNETVPDRLRGRLAGIEQVSYSVGPLLGDLEAGVVAALFGLRFSIVSGGVLCVAGVGLAALLLPGFRRYVSPRASDLRSGAVSEAPPAGKHER
jgi:MFS family permease